MYGLIPKMAAPSDPKKPPPGPASRPAAAAPAPAPASPPARTISGELGLPALSRYTGPDPKVVCGLLKAPGPSDQVLEVVAHVTVEALAVSLGPAALPALRGPVRSRMDSGPQPPAGESPLPVGGAAAFEMELAITRFHDRAYAVSRVGPGVPLGDSDESTVTGLQKVAWKLPRPC